MTVFNLKEISSKLKNFKTISTHTKSDTSPLKINLSPKANSTTASVILSALNNQKQAINLKEPEIPLEPNNQSTDINNNDLNNAELQINNEPENSPKDFLQEDLQERVEIQDSDLQEKPNQKPIDSKETNTSQEKLQPQTNNLPYHYSDYENLYICNLCNCTYDSLRSIKAHLWKHSGHHELSYPIHDYNNRENNNSFVQSKQSVKNQAIYIPNLGNFH